MSAKDALDEILAEVERRRLVWTELQRVAIDVMYTVDAYARTRGICDGSWIYTEAYGNSVVIYFDGRSSRSEGEVGVFVEIDGAIGKNIAEHNANILYQGYPDLRADAPALFQQVAIEGLVSQVNQYCDQQGQGES